MKKKRSFTLDDVLALYGKVVRKDTLSAPNINGGGMIGAKVHCEVFAVVAMVAKRFGLNPHEPGFDLESLTSCDWGKVKLDSTERSAFINLEAQYTRDPVDLMREIAERKTGLQWIAPKRKHHKKIVRSK